MLFVLLALLIGAVAGLRAMTAPALVSWAVHAGLFSLGGSWLAFLGYAWTPWILTACAAGELVNDKLPGTPNRKVPSQFFVRLVMGGLSGMALTASGGGTVWGLLAGVFGAVGGTLGGAWGRAALVREIGGKDLPVALLEDFIAIGCGVLIVSQMH